MSRKGIVFIEDIKAGTIEEKEDGFFFFYDPNYLSRKDAVEISVTLPLQKETHFSKMMFSFFDGLIPEGWLLDIARQNWKIDVRDRMGLLLACCRDCIGNISVFSENDEAQS